MLVDAYRKGWAIRCLREAIDEIKIAHRDGRAFNLIFDALRKIEMAVYYCFGEPFIVEGIVEELIERGLTPRDPILKYLVEMKRTIRRLEGALQSYLDSIPHEEVNDLLSTASKIVDLMTSTCADD